jgi:hypothetical protein
MIQRYTASCQHFAVHFLEMGGAWLAAGARSIRAVCPERKDTDNPT